MSNRIKKLNEIKEALQKKENVAARLRNAKDRSKKIERFCLCESDPIMKEKLLGLMDIVYKKAPKIVCTECSGGFKLLVRLDPWLNPITTWEPKGKGRDSLFQSLVDHLLCKYSVPKFLYKIFYKRQIDVKNGTIFKHLAQGGSLTQIDKAILPVSLTKKMRAEFLKLPAETSGLIEGIRTVQVKSLNGTPIFLNAILATTIGQNFQHDEEFCFTVIQWFCNNPLLDKKHVGPLIDYIYHLKFQDQNFSMKGRSPLALIRGMEEWHGTLARIKAMKGLVFNPCGLEPGSFVVKKFIGDKKIENHWTITEILSSKELAEEGRSLRHCVYSYANSIADGLTSIWSMKENGERQITIEIRNALSSIVQIRGKCNRFPNLQERDIIRRWANNNYLNVAYSCL